MTSLMKKVVLNDPFFNHSCAIEYKTKPFKKRMNYKSDFEPQQLPYLERATTTRVYKKLSDMDPSLKPFDAFLLVKAKAYVIAGWYKIREYKNVYVIPIESILKHKESNKSLSEDDAKTLSVKTICL
jgi:hypothetical protein